MAPLAAAGFMVLVAPFLRAPACIVFDVPAWRIWSITGMTP
jgi:hypothetical protein